MLTIIGHGPSILCGLGPLIDTHTVVRLKDGKTQKQPAEHFGTRTDYLCGRSYIYRQDGVPFWHMADDSPWIDYFAQFKPKLWKPSHGLSAVFCAIDHLDPSEIGVIGFDRILYPNDDSSHKWDTPGKPPHPWPHCQRAEYECLYSLGVDIIDLAKVYGEVPRV